MKKKLFAVLMTAVMVLSLCACGAKEENATTTEETTQSAEGGVVSTKDYNPEDYVTVGDISAVEVTVDVVNFTDADVESQFNEEVDYYVEANDLYEYTLLDKTVVEEGDVANIDYVGKKDGVAFDGGTAQGHNLEIGSGKFIDGFEDGLIGHEVGETTTLNLTFPENYQNADLAGAAVTFDVTINGIYEKELPEVNDALIAKLGVGFDTIEAYKEDLKNYLQETCDETNLEEKKTAVWEAVYALCTVNDPPEAYVNDLKATISKNAEMYAQYYQVSLEEFVETYMGYTMEEYEAECQGSAVESAKQRMAVAAVAQKLGIAVSDDDVRAQAEQEYEDYGFESADALLSNIGNGEYYDYVLSNKVYEYLMEYATIKENPPVSLFAEEELDDEDLEGGEEIIVEGDEYDDEEYIDEEYLEEDPTEDLILQTE